MIKLQSFRYTKLFSNLLASTFSTVEVPMFWKWDFSILTLDNNFLLTKKISKKYLILWKWPWRPACSVNTRLLKIVSQKIVNVPTYRHDAFIAIFYHFHIFCLWFVFGHDFISILFLFICQTFCLGSIWLGIGKKYPMLKTGMRRQFKCWRHLSKIHWQKLHILMGFWQG